MYKFGSGTGVTITLKVCICFGLEEGLKHKGRAYSSEVDETGKFCVYIVMYASVSVAAIL